jgi:hypothetical protein
MEWEGRRPGELTTEYLGRVLDFYLYLPGMARRARQGHFDDYFCPPEVDDGLNMHRLVMELQAKLERVHRSAPQHKRIREVMQGVIDGEFDGTQEESQRWAASKAGQDTFKQLLGE